MASFSAAATSDYAKFPFEVPDVCPRLAVVGEFSPWLHLFHSADRKWRLVEQLVNFNCVCALV
jgi:hypothetical protein